ncbi:acetamidase/formamidase family protein [Actinomadura scrupuli]|uniref:acetamidase/formamidase family protein n=1 Tax=Actinomadura scrupuli TaxID=559629 RepID=UPI003D96D951
MPGHNRWHPDIPAVAEVISGGSVRMECQSRWDLDERDPNADAILCGPLSVVGAQPGDVIVVDILALGRSDGRYAGAAHPGIIGCAPGAESLRSEETGLERAGLVESSWVANGRGGETGPIEDGSDGVLLGHVRPGLAAYEPLAAQAVRSVERGRQIGGCSIARLTAGSRIMLPVHALGAKLSVGDLHFPEVETGDCLDSARAGWIDLRINLTKRGVERFRITGPMLMPDPNRAA